MRFHVLGLVAAVLLVAPLVASAAGEAAFLYDRAFRAVSAHDDDKARPLLEAIIRDYPDQPEAVYSQALLRELELRHGLQIFPHPLSAVLLPPDTIPGRPDRAQLRLHGPRAFEERPTGAASIVLGATQLLNGVISGTFVCAAVRCVGAAPAIIAVDGAADLGFALILASRGVTMGHALALSAGPAFGLWTAFALTQLFPTTSTIEFTMLAAGELLGTGFGELAWAVFQPTVGEVALATSGALWLGAIAGLGGAAARLALSGTLEAAVIASSVGLVLGGALSSQIPMSFSRVLLVNASALVGGAAGAGVASIAVSATEASRLPPWWFAAGAGGGALGFVVGVILTRSFDGPELQAPQLALLPTWNNSVSPGLAFRF